MRRRIAQGMGRRVVVVLCGIVLWSLPARAAQLSADRVQAAAGATGVGLSIGLASEADESVASLQFDLLFPDESLTVDAVVIGSAAASAGKSLSMSTIDPGHIRVLIAGINQTVISDGAVAELSLSVGGGVSDGEYPVSLDAVTLSSPAGQPVSATVVPGAVEVGDEPVHTADLNGDYQISFSELLRVIQLFNGNLFHCDGTTEDGYALGPGDESCEKHNSDFFSPHWTLQISELLRLIQFYNLNGYESSNDSEDGFRAVSSS